MLFSNMDDGKHEVYTLEINSPYTGHSSELFYNYPSADYWSKQYYNNPDNVCRGTLRKLCKRHANMHNSSKHGKCCKILLEF